MISLPQTAVYKNRRKLPHPLHKNDFHAHKIQELEVPQDHVPVPGEPFHGYSTCFGRLDLFSPDNSKPRPKPPLSTYQPAPSNALSQYRQPAHHPVHRPVLFSTMTRGGESDITTDNARGMQPCRTTASSKSRQSSNRPTARNAVPVSTPTTTRAFLSGPRHTHFCTRSSSPRIRERGKCIAAFRRQDQQQTHASTAAEDISSTNHRGHPTD